MEHEDGVKDTKSIRMLIADDHPVVRAGIKTMIEKEPDLSVVGESAAGDRVEDLTRQWRPDVLVLDVNMPGLDPVAATRSLKKHHPTLNILVLTCHGRIMRPWNGSLRCDRREIFVI
ncbi:MAG: response regulator transcription factor [Anaerolineae bacterium]|nr:response regulator transcription factor [Anaerolineae bacterium]